MTCTVCSLRRILERLSSLPLRLLTLKVFAGIITGGEPIYATLHPLFRLTEIRQLTLCLTMPDLVGDSWLEEAVQSWPHLDLLRVTFPYNRKMERYHGKRNEPPTMTLAGLIPLLKHCPRLSYLDIPLFVKPFDLSLLCGISDSTIILVFFHFPRSNPLRRYSIVWSACFRDCNISRA